MRGFVPRTDNTGELGTAKKRWKEVRAVNFYGTLQGKASSADTCNGNAATASSCSGNAASASKLQTARTINGVAFNGTANITITAAANGGNSTTVGGYSVGNAANKIPVYSADGHLVLPSGAEIW